MVTKDHFDTFVGVERWNTIKEIQAEDQKKSQTNTSKVSGTGSLVKVKIRKKKK